MVSGRRCQFFTHNLLGADMVIAVSSFSIKFATPSEPSPSKVSVGVQKVYKEKYKWEKPSIE